MPVETWTVAWNPYQNQLASGSQSGNVNLWNVDTCEKTSTIETRGKFIMSVDYVSVCLDVSAAGWLTAERLYLSTQLDLILLRGATMARST